MTEALLSEELLRKLWNRRYLGQGPFILEDGKKLLIKSFGIPNAHAGPDFVNATLIINEIELRGDVEIHVESGDWEKHGHDTDLLYSNVILNVAFRRSDESTVKKNASGKEVYQLILQPYLKRSVISLLRKTRNRKKESTKAPESLKKLEQAGCQRFKNKATYFGTLLPVMTLEEILYRGIMIALGYKRNKAQFNIISQRVAYENLKNIPVREAEKIFFELADEIPFREGGVRPANFPRRRLLAAARFFVNTRGELVELFQKVIENKKPDVTPKDFCNQFCQIIQSYSDKLIGKQRAQEIVFNVILPCFYSYYQSKGDEQTAEFIFDVFRRHPSVNFDYLYKLLMLKVFPDMDLKTIKKMATLFCQQWGALDIEQEQ